MYLQIGDVTRRERGLVGVQPCPRIVELIGRSIARRHRQKQYRIAAAIGRGVQYRKPEFHQSAHSQRSRNGAQLANPDRPAGSMRIERLQPTLSRWR
jgi:hypothetical protein